MEIQLTEEISTDMYKHFSAYHEIIIKINELAYSRLNQYYEQYLKAKQYWFRPMSEKKFFSKIAAGSGYLTVLKKHSYPVVTCNNPRTTTINQKAHLNDGVHIESVDVDLLYATIDCPILNWATEPQKVKDILNLMDNYLTVPYKVDSNIIQLYEKVKEKNFSRVSVLKRCGVEYDL